MESPALSPPSELVYWPQRGYGFLAPTKPFAYDKGYFENYKRLEGTWVGQELISLRLQMLRKYASQHSTVLDYGCGAGGFVKQANCKGFDVIPETVAWLKERGLFHDPERDGQVDCICFWDSLEHLLVPDRIVALARQFVLVSIPIFEGGDSILGSKHYKPEEHLFYFSEKGLIRWFKAQGFTLVERHRDEERFGRDGIGTFAFQRDR